jgi:hypothetical protein
MPQVALGASSKANVINVAMRVIVDNPPHPREIGCCLKFFTDFLPINFP